MRQLIQLQVHLAGFQETCFQEQRKQQDDFLLISGGCNGKLLGCFLMVNIVPLYAEVGGKDYLFKADHFAVMFEDPRLLVINVVTPFMQIRIVVAHALSAGAEPHLKDSWYNNLKKFLAPNMQITVFIDANARSELLELPEPTGDFTIFDNAARFKDVLLQAALQLPSDNPSLTDKLVGTWEGPGRWQTIDYVQFKQTWRTDDAMVFKDFHTLNLAQDLRPVLVKATLTLRSKIKKPKPAPISVRRLNLDNAKRLSFLQHHTGYSSVTRLECFA